MQGAYVGAADPSGMASFAAATQTSPTIATDYLPGNTVVGHGRGRREPELAASVPGRASGYTLSLGVPMIPTNSSGTASATLAAGCHRSLQRLLRDAGPDPGRRGPLERLPAARLGVRRSWIPWNATTPAAEASYAAYFQQIVTAMRSVSGSVPASCGTPSGSLHGVRLPVAAAYPGNAYVDVIGLDAYDQSWADSADGGQRLVLRRTRALGADRGTGVRRLRQRASPRLHGVGRHRSAATGTGSATTRTASTTWSRGCRPLPTTWPSSAYFDFNSRRVNSLITGGISPTVWRPSAATWADPHTTARSPKPGDRPSPRGGCSALGRHHEIVCGRVVLERRRCDAHVPRDRRGSARWAPRSCVPCDSGSTKLNVMLLRRPVEDV